MREPLFDDSAKLGTVLRNRGGDPYPWLPGFQIGLVNAGGGIQIGILNYNPQGFLLWFPIINFPYGGEW